MINQGFKKYPFDLGTAFPVLASFLTTADKISFASTCHMFRNLIFRANIWHTFQLNEVMLAQRTLQQHYEQWVKKYIQRIQPRQISINLKVEQQEQQSKLQKLIPQFFHQNKQFVKQLTIRSNSHLLHLWMTFCCKNINKLTLHSNKITDQLVEKMFQSYQHLNQLEINADALEFTASNIDNYVKSPLFKLVLKPYQLNYESILRLLLNSMLNQISQFQIDVELCEESLLLKIINELKCVKKLRLYHMQSFYDAELIASKMSKQISQLTLTKCYNLQMEPIISKISSKELQQLDLTEAILIKDIQIDLLAEKAYNLKHVNLSWCNQITDNSIRKLIQNCKYIQKLVLNGIKKLSDQAFTEYNLLKPSFKEKEYDEQRYHFKNQFKKKQWRIAEDFCSQYMAGIKQDSFFKKPVPQRKTLRWLKHLQCISCNNVNDLVLKIIGSFSGKCSVINYYSQQLQLLNTNCCFQDDFY